MHPFSVFVGNNAKSTLTTVTATGANLIPAGYRPLTTLTFMIPLIIANAGQPTACRMTITSGGVMTFYPNMSAGSTANNFGATATTGVRDYFNLTWTTQVM